MLNKKVNAFTLIEVLVSVAIIMILSVASIPFFKGMSEKQILSQNAKSFMSDVSLMQVKARSGVTTNGIEKVWWAVEPCATDSNGNNSNPNRYAVGSVKVVDNSGSLSFDWDSFNKTKQLHNFPENVKFDKSSVCNLGVFPVAFERLSGKPNDKDMSSIDSLDIKICTVKDSTKECEASDRSMSVYLNKSGSIRIQ